VDVSQLRQEATNVVPYARTVADPPTLYDYLYPRWFVLHACLGEDGTLQSHSPDPQELGWTAPGEGSDDLCFEALELETWVPNWYSSRQVRLGPLSDDRDPLLYGPAKVYVDAGKTPCFFKPLGPSCGSTQSATIRELSTLRKIHQQVMLSNLPASLRTCRLHGLVRDTGIDSEAGSGVRCRIIGLLLTFVKEKIPRIHGSSLYQVVFSSDASQRQLWAGQLRDMVRQLHGAGCVWGDAKPENIMVDSSDQLWLIDFGGGCTLRWVSKENRETFQGDREGVDNICKWLEDPKTYFQME
jgi:hypothetical protein